MSPTFQHASRADTDLLLELVRALYEFEGIAFEVERIRRGLAELMANPHWGGAWLIRCSGAVVGYFVLAFGFDLEFGGRQATVTELYLTPESRRAGTGTATLLFVEATLRELGIGEYELQADRANVAALAFYRRFGFHIFDRVPMSKSVPMAKPQSADE